MMIGLAVPFRIGGMRFVMVIECIHRVVTELAGEDVKSILVGAYSEPVQKIKMPRHLVIVLRGEIQAKALRKDCESFTPFPGCARAEDGQCHHQRGK